MGILDFLRHPFRATWEQTPIAPDLREHLKATIETWADDHRLDVSFHESIDLARNLSFLVAAHLERAREAAYEKAAEAAPLQCACRCRAHRQHGCPKCLAVESCQVHAEVDVSSLERGK